MEGLSIIHLVLLITAFILFVLATWQPANPNRDRFVSAGLAAFVASMIRW